MHQPTGIAPDLTERGPANGVRSEQGAAVQGPNSKTDHQAGPAVSAGAVIAIAGAERGAALLPSSLPDWVGDEAAPRFALLVEAPSLALAAALQADDTLTPATALASWLRSAAELRAHLRQHRPHTTVFDAEELRTASDHQMAAYGLWAQDLPARAATLCRKPAGALLRALCEPLLPSDPEAVAVFEELHAACELLFTDSPTTLAFAGPPSGAAMQALAQLQQLRQELREASRARSELVQANELANVQLRRAESALDEARQGSTSASIQLTAHRTEIQDLRVEMQQYQTRLQQAQEELDRAQQTVQAAQAETRSLVSQLTHAAAAAEATAHEQHALLSEARAQADATQALRARVAALEPLQMQLGDSQAECHSLRLQIDQTQADLEALWIDQSRKKHEAQRELDDLRTMMQEATTANSSLQSVADANAKALGAAQLECDALRKVQAADRVTAQRLRADLGEARRVAGELPSLRRSLEEANQRIGLQEQQLNIVHEELLHHYLRLKAYEATSEPVTTSHHMVNAGHAGAGHTGAAYPWGSVSMGDVHQHPPHSHMDFMLHQVLTPGGERENLKLRLLEHGERPGIGIFCKLQQPAPLGHWVERGREGDDSFMLLIPQDLQGASTVQRLPSNDWLFVNQLARGLADFLANQAGADVAHWQAVAAKLVVQLAQVAPRLRYDGLVVAPADVTAPAGTITVTFSHVIFGQQVLNQLALQWQPGGVYDESGGQTALALLLPGAGAPEAPPFAGWPLLADGGWARRWVLPVGRGLSNRTLRSRWAAMSTSDRDFLLALLDALPATAPQLGAMNNEIAWTGADALRDARALFKQARAAVRAIQLRRGLRRLVRR
jgi:colicin import membrane protein